MSSNLILQGIPCQHCQQAVTEALTLAGAELFDQIDTQTPIAAVQEKSHQASIAS